MYYPRLKELREDGDFVQKEVAAVLGIDQRVYSNYEIGKREIPTHYVIKLAEFYKTSTDYILGRTTWDRAHSYAINPNAKYYPCSRVLRAPFYKEKWSIEKAERHSIYVGNGYHALKGLHFVVMALP